MEAHLELLTLLQKELVVQTLLSEQSQLTVVEAEADTQVQVQDYLEDPEAEVATPVLAVVQHKQVFLQ